MKFDTVIGLEVHCELKTKTKMFCSCKNEFGAEPNTNVCPVCLALPGALPVINKHAIELAVRAGLATNCSINNTNWFERKSYFYPDLPKAYQISQLEMPLNINGFVEINVNGVKKKVRLNRIHCEEDASKLNHDEIGGGSLVDHNRGGVPLIEIVSEPDITSAEEAVAYLEALRNILVYAGVSDCKMQEGMLRCDVNLSIKPAGSPTFGTRTEMKNLNSFKAVFRAINYERDRQIKVVEAGGVIKQETMRWDDNKGRSISMRSKEDATDYRYFPDPDLLPIYVSPEYIEKIRKDIPMLPSARVEKYMKEYNLPEYDANLLVSDIAISNFFEESLKLLNKPKLLSNWIMTDVMRKLKDKDPESEVVLKVSPTHFTALLKILDANEITGNTARAVFDKMWDDGVEPEDYITKQGLKQENNDDVIKTLVADILAKNPQSVSDYKTGKNKGAIGFLVGQVMKASNGKANPQKVNQLLNEELNK